MREPAWGRKVQEESSDIIHRALGLLAARYPDDPRTTILFREVAVTMRYVRMGSPGLPCSSLEAHPETVRIVDEAQARGVR